MGPRSSSIAGARASGLPPEWARPHGRHGGEVLGWQPGEERQGWGGASPSMEGPAGWGAGTWGVPPPRVSPRVAWPEGDRDSGEGHQNYRTEVYRVPTNAKVEVPRPYTGEAGKGPSLKAHLADLEAVATRWRENRLSMRFFFRQLAPTLDGEAKLFYINEMENILAEPERAADGTPLKDARGREVPLEDPCHLWASMLMRRFGESRRRSRGSMIGSAAGPTRRR